LAEPSVKRDGYAVGSREGSMYRSSGNLNVTAGSRAGSETRDQPSGWSAGRRASTSDIKGSGIRTGGNQIEPSVKSQNFCMPFGSAKASGGFIKKKTKAVVNQSAQQITESKLQSKRERNRTISGDTSSQVRMSSSSSTHESRSMTKTSSSYQAGSALSGITSALQQIEVNEHKQNVTMPMPRKGRRAQSLPRGQTTNEQSSFMVSLPGSARTSRQASVEPDHNRKTLSRHGSVEIFDGAYNLTVPNKLTRHSSTSKLEEIHTDHIKIVGELENEEQTGVVKNENCNIAATSSSSSLASTQNQDISSSYAQSSASQNISSSMSSNSITSLQSRETYSETSTKTTQSSFETVQQSSMQQSKSETQRSRHASNTNSTIVSGNKFNISNGLKRQSQEDLSRRSRHVSGSVDNNGVGSALKGLDVALEQIASQQKREETQYVSKDNGVTNVRVSLPASKNTSRATSRRNSVDLGSRGRSRRGSLDIYAAEYAVKIGNKKNITDVQQKNSFQLKIENQDESDWGVTQDNCEYQGDRAKEFAQKRACIEAQGWEPYQEWFYDNEFRSWWQVMGCVGVPLYKIYPRKTQWRTVRPVEVEEDNKLSRNDSVDDMIAQVLNKKY